MTDDILATYPRWRVTCAVTGYYTDWATEAEARHEADSSDRRVLPCGPHTVEEVQP